MNFLPLPTTEEMLILFLAELAQTVAHSTIKAYQVVGVRHLHVVNGFGNPLEKKLRLELVLKGIHRDNHYSHAPGYK